MLQSAFIFSLFLSMRNLPKGKDAGLSSEVNAKLSPVNVGE
jgi:hypothetical protein